MSEKLEPGKSYWLPITQVVTGRYKIREKIGGQELEELKQSMAERGQLQPVVVQSTPGSTTEHRVVLLIGERRVKAAQELGWEKIWCTPVYGGGDFSNAAAVLVENIQRKNLAPLEEARAIKALTETIFFEGENLSDNASPLTLPSREGSSDIWQSQRTQEEIAKGLGKRQPYISEMLQIASLTEEEISKLSDSDKLKKEKLLQLLKSREPKSQKPPGPPPDPVKYHFKGSRLTFKGSVDFETDDLDAAIAKVEELLAKMREKRAAKPA